MKHILLASAAIALLATNPLAAKDKDKDKSDAAKPGAVKGGAFNKDPYPSTYARYGGVETLITNVTIYDGEAGGSKVARSCFAMARWLSWVRRSKQPRTRRSLTGAANG